jgi:hypothetical protein
MAYLMRKTKSVNLIEGLNNLNYKPKPSIDVLTENIEEEIKEKPSIKTKTTSEYFLDENEDKNEPSINLSNKERKTSNLLPKQDKTISKNASGSETTGEEQEETEYKETVSTFIKELADLDIDRDNISKLNLGFYENSKSVIWISVHYKCLVECLLTFSEMKSIELDDLKEVCNAFTFIIHSKYFQYLPNQYPYIQEIIDIHKTLKKLCLNEEENEFLKFILGYERKKILIITRWELSHYVPKKTFNQLNFKD